MRKEKRRVPYRLGRRSRSRTIRGRESSRQYRSEPSATMWARAHVPPLQVLMDAAQLEDALDELQAHLFKLTAIRPVAVLDGCLAALAELNQSRTNDSSGFNDRRTKLLNLFARATLAASGAEDALTTPTPIDKLFSPSHSSQRRKDIALRMVRLESTDM